MKKYEFTGDIKTVEGRTLHRIIAIRDFGDVKTGDLGGWIEKEDNLSHEGNAWVYLMACVFDDAQVRDNARVLGRIYIHGKVRVIENAHIFGEFELGGNCCIAGNARIFDRRQI